MVIANVSFHRIQRIKSASIAAFCPAFSRSGPSEVNQSSPEVIVIILRHKRHVDFSAMVVQPQR